MENLWSNILIINIKCLARERENTITESQNDLAIWISNLKQEDGSKGSNSNTLSTIVTRDLVRASYRILVVSLNCSKAPSFKCSLPSHTRSFPRQSLGLIWARFNPQDYHKSHLSTTYLNNLLTSVLASLGLQPSWNNVLELQPIFTRTTPFKTTLKHLPFIAQACSYLSVGSWSTMEDKYYPKHTLNQPRIAPDSLDLLPKNLRLL